MRKVAAFLVLISCSRNTVIGTEQELESILGEKVACFRTVRDEGFLCKAVSGRNYYCPDKSKDPCFFTSRLQLLDVPAEKPK